MPKVVIKKQTSYSAQDTYSRVKDLLSNDKDLKKLDPSYSCQFDDSGLTGLANGKMFKANMSIHQNKQGCEVELVIELPLALALAKGMVQKTLEKKLTDSLT